MRLGDAIKCDRCGAESAIKDSGWGTAKAPYGWAFRGDGISCDKCSPLSVTLCSFAVFAHKRTTGHTLREVVEAMSGLLAEFEQEEKAWT